MRADYIIKNAQVYMTFRQCFERRDVAVLGDKILEVSPKIFLAEGGCRAEGRAVCDEGQAGEHAESCRTGSGNAGAVIDGSGMYLIPGLVDIHMHIESSMTYPKEFSYFALKAGTTTVVADSHEIANVFGMEGIRAFMDQETPLDIFYAIPSSVPATSMELETAGASIGPDEVRALLADARILCLGEVMNFKEVVREREQGKGLEGEETQIQQLIRICRELRGRDVRIEGHCPKITGEDLDRFIFAGIDADHTQQTADSVLEKSDLGMFLELQAKSLTKEVVEVVCSRGLYENVALVTDDTMPDHLLEGQLDRIVRTAVAAGMPLEKAVYCATYTPARRMHLDDRGLIGPGKKADFVLLEDLEGLKAAAVFKDGRLVYEADGLDISGGLRDLEGSGVLSGLRDPEGPGSRAEEPDGPVDVQDRQGREESAAVSPGLRREGTVDSEQQAFPPHFYHSVHCKKAEPSDFILKVEKPCAKVLANVMKISTFGTVTEQVQRELAVRDGQVCWQEAGLCLAVLFERHGKNGNIAYGLVEGAFQEKGAAATTWSHDSHNLLVLGSSIQDMIAAQHRVLKLEGGFVAARDGRILAEARLAVGGIISDAPLEELAHDLGQVRKALRELGYVNNNEIMSMGTLALPVSPALKLTDYGLLDVKSQARVPLIEAYR